VLSAAANKFFQVGAKARAVLVAHQIMRPNKRRRRAAGAGFVHIKT